MKIIAVSGNWVCVETKEEFIVYDTRFKTKKILKKETYANYAKALTAKWGYEHVDPPVTISSIELINRVILKEVRKNTIPSPAFF